MFKGLPLDTDPGFIYIPCLKKRVVVQSLCAEKTGGAMYVITRVWETKPREARRAATLAALIGEVYEKAGQRSQIQVSFNGGTLPGETDRVYMRWIAERIESPYRGSNEIPAEAQELGTKMREITLGSWISFEELLTVDKRQE